MAATRMIAAVALVVLAACTPRRDAARGPTPAPSARAATGSDETVTIATNTQATLGDLRIGAGNFWDGDYEDATGARRHGRTAGLWLSVRTDPAAARFVRVGPGSRVVTEPYTLEVIEVTGESVRLRVVSAR